MPAGVRVLWTTWHDGGATGALCRSSFAVRAEGVYKENNFIWEWEPTRVWST